jgi:hypothetical protein
LDVGRREVPLASDIEVSFLLGLVGPGSAPELRGRPAALRRSRLGPLGSQPGSASLHEAWGLASFHLIFDECTSTITVTSTSGTHLESLNRTLPMVRAFLDVEMIRDGGSWAASFKGDNGHEYILFLKIHLSRGLPARADSGTSPGRPEWARTVVEVEWLGHHAPLLIDPEDRPPDTESKRYSRLSGASIPISWTDARQIMDAVAPLAVGLDPLHSEWLAEMAAVTTREGSVPNGAKREWQSFGR